MDQSFVQQFLSSTQPKAKLLQPGLDLSAFLAPHPEKPTNDTKLAGTISPSGSTAAQTTPLAQYLPGLLAIITQIKSELDQNITKLLTLNPSRREAVVLHLERLANIAPGPSMSQGTADAGAGLRRWIEGPRSPAQTLALQIYFEEIAMVIIGEVLLLKAWSDRGLRPLREEDLGKLGWVLFNTLKQHVPLDREGWIITRANLYSWYNPGPSIQRETWRTIEGWKILDEGPDLIASLLKAARKKLAAGSDFASYDERFYRSIWQHLPRIGFDLESSSSPVKRKRVAFSPTLRDGSMVRSGPVNLTWLALESHPFRLIAAELTQLWWGPAPPPCWNPGSGLEVHRRDQLQLQLGSPKPTLNVRIAEMEACDLAFVAEEKTIRASSRTSDGSKFREQLEAFPYFKKLRSPQCSLGALQACVAITKLRPGGLLWWAREEELGPHEGGEVIRHLFDHGRLLCEWRLDQLQWGLSGVDWTGVAVPLPKFLYLFSRDSELSQRHAHRPLRVSAQGAIRSHLEVSMFLDEALNLASHPGEIREGSRSQWQIHCLQSPHPQKEWVDRWPDATATQALAKLERLKTTSVPLASMATLRPTPPGDPKRNHAWTMHATAEQSIRGFWIKADAKASGGRRLCTLPLPRYGAEAVGSGLIVLVRDESWIAPLRAYLESDWTTDWLDHHCERKGESWLIKEPVARLIPVPCSIAEALGPSGTETASNLPFALPLPGDWERLSTEMPTQPRKVLTRLSTLSHDEAGKRIRSELFVRAARAIEHLESTQGKLLSLVGRDGKIDWGEMLAILPHSERTSMSMHPELRLTGALPPHLPIARMTRVKSPMPGWMLSTEAGFNLHIASDQPILLEMLGDQLVGAENSTWAELLSHVSLPRSTEFAISTASDLLKAHSEQQTLLSELREALNACLDL